MTDVKKTGAVSPVSKAELPPLSERRVPRTPVEEGEELRRRDQAEGKIAKPTTRATVDESEGRKIVEEAQRRAAEQSPKR